MPESQEGWSSLLIELSPRGDGCGDLHLVTPSGVILELPRRMPVAMLPVPGGTDLSRQAIEADPNWQLALDALSEIRGRAVIVRTSSGAEWEHPAPVDQAQKL